MDFDFELPAVSRSNSLHSAGSGTTGASGDVGLERDFRRSSRDHAAADGVPGDGVSAHAETGATGAHTLAERPLPVAAPSTNFSRPIRPRLAAEPAHVEQPAHTATPGVVGQANDHGFNAAPQAEAGHAGAAAPAAPRPSRLSRWADRNKGFGDALDKALKPYTVPLTTIAGVSGLAIAGTALGVNLNKKS